jgi:DNA-binding NarL/FixJ family response regulator
VILITGDESRAFVDEALQAGVSGYLLNDPSADVLERRARLVLEAISSTQPDPPPLPPAASAALAVPIQQAEDVPTHVGKPLRRQNASRSHVV